MTHVCAQRRGEERRGGAVQLRELTPLTVTVRFRSAASAPIATVPSLSLSLSRAFGFTESQPAFTSKSCALKRCRLISGLRALRRRWSVGGAPHRLLLSDRSVLRLRAERLGAYLAALPLPVTGRLGRKRDRIDAEFS